MIRKRYARRIGSRTPIRRTSRTEISGRTPSRHPDDLRGRTPDRAEVSGRFPQYRRYY